MIKFLNLLKLIKYPYFSKKGFLLLKNNQYIFIVHKTLTKPNIKYIFKNYFNLDILKINTSILPLKQKIINKKKGFKPQYKKIYIIFKQKNIFEKLLN